MNDFESVNFIQSEKLRCMNNASESLDGEEYGLGHYSFATTSFVKAQLKCPLSSSIKMTTLISHSLY
ncbi:hypothetical protein, partial [Raoultella ornithinolytica]|uniref:hypothetical protein n=1 Tax=Raoultella ornithinolytica TaxID=54291 RepID=UPI0039B5B061